MARFEELDEQAQQQWLARIARERESVGFGERSDAAAYCRR